MAGLRFSLQDFSLANPIYSTAEVAVYAVDEDTQTVTTTLATLYADQVGTSTLSNPQSLDNDGKWQQPVYVDAPVVMSVLGSDLTTHTTGIVGTRASFRDEWATDTAYIYGDTVLDGAAGNDTGNQYINTTTHTSGDWDDDLAAGNWLLTVVAFDGTDYLPIAGGTVTGGLNVSGQFVATTNARIANLWVAPGAYSMEDTFSAGTSPFAVSMTLPRVNGASAPPGKRNIMQMAILQDRALPVASANQGPSVNALEIVQRSGVAGGAVADSWGGSRTMLRVTWTEDNSPVESLNGPENGKVTPAVNVTWSTIFAKYNRGGTAPEYGKARGSNFLDYGMVSHIAGSTNLTNSRLYEGALFFQAGTSVRNAFGWALQTPLTAGAAPAEVYTAYTTGAGGKTSHSWRTVFGIGETGWGGIDPLHGTLLSFKASHAAPVPQARNGIDIQDVHFSGRAIKWIGGDISGGAHGTVSSGRLRLGNGYLTPSAAGLEIDAVGYRGSPSGTIMTLGVNLVNGDPVVDIRNNSIGDDDYGGTYQFYSPDYATNEFRAVKVLNPPRTNGAAPSNPIEVRLRYNSSAKVEFPVTNTATATSHPTELTATIADYYVGRYLAYYTGVCTGEKQLITAYDETTHILTTNAFTTAPTASVNVIGNYSFSAVLPTVPDTIVNSWQFTLNGGTGTVVRETSPNSANLTGDGTNAASLDQTFSWPATTGGVLYLVAAGNYRVMLGTTRGASDLLDVYVEAETPDVDEDYPFVPEDLTFYSAGTTVWLRIENTSTITAKIRNVRCADATSGAAILLGVRAGVEAVPLTVNHTWTQLNTLALQPGGGAATFGGTLGVTGAVTGASFIPSGSAVPSNGLYLPAANTLGFAINSAADMRLTASSLSPAVSDGLALGTSALMWSDVFFASGGVLNFNNGDVTLTHSADLLTLAGGGLSLTGSGTGLAVTNNATIGGTVITTGSETAASFIPSSATVPTNGMYLPAANTLGWSVASTAEMRMDGTALFAATNDGLALGKSANAFSDAFFASGAILDFDASDITLTHASNRLAFEGGRFLFGSTTDDASTTVQVNGTFKVSSTSAFTGIMTAGIINASSVSSFNSSGTAFTTFSGVMLQAQAADGVSSTVLVEARGFYPKLSFRRANTSSASPSALVLADQMGAIEFRGHDGSAYTISRATQEALAAEAWTGSAQGTYWQWRTTAIGGTTTSIKMTLGDTGNLTLATGYLVRVSSNTGTATGTTRTDALQLSGDFKRLSTVAAGTGVILPTGVIGMAIVLVNSGANALKVYANGSETIDGVAGSTGVTLTNPGRCLYWFSAANTWHSAMFNGLSA